MRAVIVKFQANPAREVAPRTFRFVASTAARDRDKDIIEPSGWQLDGYRENPVVLLGHDNSGAPVARAARVWVEGGRLMVDIEFPPAGTSESADEVCELVKAGFLRAVSVGFRPLAWEPLADGGYRYTSVELFEISLVGVPSNPQALIAARMGGKGQAPRLRVTRGAEVPRPVTPERIRAAVRTCIEREVAAFVRANTGRLD